jgi:hypothetical protein
MTPGTEIKMNAYSSRLIATLMGFEALSLAVISPLHLSGVLGGGARPFNPTAAGTAEAVIGVVLVLGALALGRGTARGRDAAVAATAFAIIGFLVGLTFTLRGGDAIDVVYHAVMLPLLAFTMVALLRLRPTRPGHIEPQRAEPRATPSPAAAQATGHPSSALPGAKEEIPAPYSAMC